MIDFSNIPVTRGPDTKGLARFTAGYHITAKVSTSIELALIPEVARDMGRRLHNEMWGATYGEIYSALLNLRAKVWRETASTAGGGTDSLELLDKLIESMMPPH